MRVDVWTDFICPWCYLGKRRLELALEQFAGRSTVEIHWRSFQLDPEFPREFSGGVNDLLVNKYGMSRAEAEAIHARVTGLGAADGLVYRFDRCRPSNTFDAHRLLQAANRRGVGAALQDRFMRAYFAEGISLGDAPSLRALASEAGLEAPDSDAVLSGDAFGEQVSADQRRAQELGYRGVPAFLFAEKVQVSGAQSPETLLAALQRAERASS
ncbi:MAG TPA: DsbA family oxidoreductase [Polyangiaceae bacterium]|nr:DsbA family oxidoreductase [Polyangiaceae bacterium]